MASLGANATADEIDLEIAFHEVLISSLDPGADDYAERLSELEAQRAELEQRSEALQSGSQPGIEDSQERTDNMPSSHSRSSTSEQATVNGGLNSSNTYNGNSHYGGSQDAQSYTMKRPLSHSAHLDARHPSKRPSPGPSHSATPKSSVESFDLTQNPYSRPSERALRQQRQLEEAMRNRREAQVADERFARSLSQQNQPPGFVSYASSSSRPGLQTTLNSNGSFQRPPPQPKTDNQAIPSSQPYSSNGFNVYHNHVPQQESSQRPQPTFIKPEPSYARPQQLVQRPRVPDVVDLTNSDSDDDEDVSEIQSNSFTPNHRQQRPDLSYAQRSAPAVQPVYRPLPSQHAMQMPGAYPTAATNGNRYVYGSANNSAHQPYGATQQPNPLLMGAVNGIRNIAGTLSDPLSELSRLVHGRNSRVPQAGDDDDLVYGGSRQLQPGRAPYAGYDDMDLYQRRYDAIQNYDPAKTKEEINNLLANIRPDEGMPAHLRIQTPEAMAVKLHKYQELGLTWLQKCEDGSNKGGILADDMGLGKTIQMLSLIVTHKSEDPRCKTTLIVAPVALMRQWHQEIEQKIKSGRHKLTVKIHHGQSKTKSFRHLQHYDIVLTTFGSLAAELKKMERFRLRQREFPETRPAANEQCALIADDAHWYRVILDEAQCIKNVKTATAKASCMLRATYRFCMTGTPMMNNVDEFYSLIKFLRIRPYSDWTKFRLDFSTPLKSNHEETREKAMRMLQTLCKAIMLRRTKKSTFEGKPILILPERSTEIENPVFEHDEHEVYKALESRTQLQFNKYLKAGTVGTSYSAILTLLLRLRQCCCHPHLIKDFGVSAAADVSPEDLVELARKLEPQVVERIKATGGNFECPVCYDAVTNPAIFLPCGHDTCSDCFAKIADPDNAIRDGNEGATTAKCPNCRGTIDPKKITDFDSFKKVHMPELLSKEEKELLEQMLYHVEDDDDAEEAGEAEDSTTESEDDGDDNDDNGEDEVDANADLKNFIVNDDVVDSTTESEAEDGTSDGEKDSLAGPSKAPAFKGKSKKSKKKMKGKKAKGKQKGKENKKKQSKAVTLAELKKLANRSRNARKAYLRRLHADWVSSAKIEKTMEKLKEIMEDPEGEKVLVFSQWTSLLDLLEVPIDKENWSYRRYDGSMNAKMRGDAVDDFRDTKKDVRIMLVSLKAGNAGLNLNSASRVIILDPFWNPYIEEQAIDRAHRIGQTRPVQVHRMLIENTVEDRIVELQEKKRALISEALDEKASQNIGRLGVRELAYLFGVTRSPTERVEYQARDGR